MSVYMTTGPLILIMVAKSLNYNKMLFLILITIIFNPLLLLLLLPALAIICL